MKKFLALVSALLMMFLAIVPMTGACAEGSSLYVYSKNGQTVNLRSEASVNADILTRVSYGTRVTKVASAGNGWTKVTAHVNGKNVTGYMMSKFLKTSDPNHTEQTFRKVSCFTGKVAPSSSNGYVNLRAKADTKSASLARLHKGDTVTVTAANDYWYQVTTSSGTTGYMVRAYVTR